MDDFGPCCGATIGTRFLLEVRQCEAHRDDAIQAGTRCQLLIHRRTRLDRDEGGKSYHCHNNSSHNHEGQDQAKTLTAGRVCHAMPFTAT